MKNYFWQFRSNTLADDSAGLNMAEVNDTYVTILKRYPIYNNRVKNYRKYLKQLLSERLPNLQFVKSLRKSERDKTTRALYFNVHDVAGGF